MLKGKDGVVYVGDPKQKIGGVQSWNIDEQTDIVSGWGMGDAAESSFTTISRWSGSIVCYLDFAGAADGLVIGSEIAIELYPGGETSGSGYFSGNIIVSGLNRNGEKAGIPELTINFQNQGALSKGVKT